MGHAASFNWDNLRIISSIASVDLIRQLNTPQGIDFLPVLDI